MLVHAAARGRTELVRVDLAASPLARLRGWIGRRPATGEAALWLVGVRGIHTFGLRGPIDVVFVDARGRVLGVRARVAPRRLLIGPRGTHATVELPPGDAARLGVAPGDRLRLAAGRPRP
ncbi:MAG TPA: DUF192 domain-containing protein [Thermodesulfobacteriota bacterium]